MHSELNYTRHGLHWGYNDRTLHIDLSSGSILEKPVSQEMKEKFIGGRGFDLYLLWQALPKDHIVRWNDPENEICVASGPLSGMPVYPGSGKSIVVSISPLTGSVIDSNVGGYFGPYLKFAGWDALELQGKSPSETVVVIDGDRCRVSLNDGTDLPDETHPLVDALTEKFGGAAPHTVSIMSAGPGAQHTLMGCLNSSWYDAGRRIHRFKQAGRGGLGTVFRNKKIKAIVAKYSGRITVESNAPADPAAVRKVGTSYTQEIRTLDPKQNDMATIGTVHIVDVMNEFDLLPVKNFSFGSNPGARQIGTEAYRKRLHPGFDGCWLGCAMACSHVVMDFELKTGPFKGQKIAADGPEYETIAGLGSNCGIFDPDHIVEMNFYCDTYGLDTISLGTAMAFVMECYESGIIDKGVTGGLDLRFGNGAATLELVHQMARGDGFGLIVGQGVRQMKKIFADKYKADPGHLSDIGMESKGLEFSEYVTKESLAQQGGYGLALKGPQHDEAWLIFADMVNKQMPTFEQKAENLHWFPMFRTWFGLNGLCKLPWNDVVPEDNKTTREPAKIMGHLENYATLFAAVTGKPVSEKEIIDMSERVYNFQRIFNLRMGYGTRAHDSIPYRAVGPVTKEEYESRSERYDGQLREAGMDPTGKTTQEKIEALRKYRESAYEKLVDAVYVRRGWNNDGIPTLQKIKALGIDYPDVVQLLGKQAGSK